MTGATDNNLPAGEFDTLNLTLDLRQAAAVLGPLAALLRSKPGYALAAMRQEHEAMGRLSLGDTLGQVALLLVHAAERLHELDPVNLCDNCGRVILGKRKDARWCSDRCRYKRSA